MQMLTFWGYSIELLGAILAATSQVVYGEVLWNPLSIILLWEDRAAKFFAGLLFAFAMIGTNVAGNSILFANDLTGMFPKYINIRRGQIICAIIGFVSRPWATQAKASRFFTSIGGYSVFLGPLVGVLLCDFFLIQKCKSFNIAHLDKPHGIYWFYKGWNLRVIAALLIGIAPVLPGLISNINPAIHVSKGELEFYTIAWLDGLVIAL
jgi:NCS1 family nucleobase:cation symporter-1